MNFIKKKIKGSKKGIHADEDDFDPSFIAASKPPEGAKGWVPYEERKDEESEEWLAFKQLTARVSETLQKTQDNLTKIVAESAVAEGSAEIKTGNEDDEVLSERKSSATWINFESDQNSEPNKSAKGPSRPPPPRHDAPARPPPPKSSNWHDHSETQNTNQDFEDLLGLGCSLTSPIITNGHSDNRNTLEALLTDDFGFSSNEKVEGVIDLGDALADEGDDPFDTSFVSVTETEVKIKDEGRPSFKSKDVTLPSEDFFIAEESDLEDDPFTYPADIGVIKHETCSETKPDKMNMSFSQIRAKSPNPFLTDTSSSPNSLNPFLSGSQNEANASASVDLLSDNAGHNPFLSSAAKSDLDDLFQIGNNFTAETVKEPIQPNDLFSDFAESKPSGTVMYDFFGSVAAAETEESNVNLFGDSANTPQVSNQINDFSGNTTSQDLFGLDHESDQDKLSDTSKSSGKTAPIDISNLNFFVEPASKGLTEDAKTPDAPDYYNASKRQSIDSTGKPSVDSRKQSIDSVQQQNAEIGSRKPSLDISGRRQSMDVGGRKPSTEIINRKQSVDFSILSDPSRQLFSSTRQPIDLFEPKSQILDTITNSDNDFDPFLDIKSTPGSGINRIEEQPALDAFDIASSKTEHTAQNNVFDFFESVAQPVNVTDGLRPPAPKVKIEIPVELKQNADVLEALGQKGPKTPVEPLNVFDLPTPNPDDDNMFGLTLGISGNMPDENVNEEIEFSDMKLNQIEETDNSFVAKSINEISNAVSPVEEMDEKTDHMDQKETVDIVSDQFIENISEVNDEFAQQTEISFSSLDQANFDAFEARFESAVTVGGKDEFDPFGGPVAGSGQTVTDSSIQGFGLADEFDPFLTMIEPPAPPQPSPARFQQKEEDSDSDDSGPDFSVFIRPKMKEVSEASSNDSGPVPFLPPPPKSPMRSPAHASPIPAFNPFEKRNELTAEAAIFQEETFAKPEVPDLSFTDTKREIQRTESVESTGTPLFEEDDSEPLEEFPAKYKGEGWEMMLRQPNKKKITGQRFWKKVFVKLSDHVLHLYNSVEDKDPFQELPLQACYSLSEVSAQQYDQYGKIFTIKLQYIFYRERVGVRPGQISKVAHGQITSFGQLAKLGLPLEHAPQVSQLLKIGTQQFSDIRIFALEIEDALFRLTVHRDRALAYKTEEIQVTVQDETYVDVSTTGHVNKQLARVRIFFLAFITSMPNVELGINDKERKGKEVVGRHDIIPVITEEWIRLEDVEFHSSVIRDEFDKTRTIKLHPPDACFFELMRFRVRPPKNRELPLQVKVLMTVQGNKVEIRCDILVPGYSGRKYGQIPCEDIAIKFPIPECWIYLFRVEKHFRYGSLKSAARKPGKIKGLERLMGAATALDPSLIEVSTGQAKYEHHFHSIIWRIPRLPKEGQGAYTEHSFVCRLELTSYDQMPDDYEKYVTVEFTMPATTVSHTTCRSISVSNPTPPEKHVRYISKHEYRVEINHVKAFAENVYIAATSAAANSPKDTQHTSEHSSPST